MKVPVNTLAHTFSLSARLKNRSRSGTAQRQTRLPAAGLRTRALLFCLPLMLTLLFPLFSRGQACTQVGELVNLVSNGGFESHPTLPYGGFAFGMQVADYWMPLGDSPDLFVRTNDTTNMFNLPINQLRHWSGVGASPVFWGPLTSIPTPIDTRPTTYTDPFFPDDNNAFAGLLKYHNNNEGIINTLCCKLQPDRHYVLTFWLNALAWDDDAWEVYHTEPTAFGAVPEYVPGGSATVDVKLWNTSQNASYSLPAVVIGSFPGWVKVNVPFNINNAPQTEYDKLEIQAGTIRDANLHQAGQRNYFLIDEVAIYDSTYYIIVEASQTDICPGQSVTLTATASSGTGGPYTWQPGNHIDSVFTVSPAATTTYTVTAIDSVCFRPIESTITITVHPLPTPTVTGPANVCAGNTANLTGNGGATYTWHTPLQPTGTGNTAVTPPIYEPVTYTVTATSEHGCSDSVTFTIGLHPAECCPNTYSNPGDQVYEQTEMYFTPGSSYHVIDAAALGGTVVFDGTYHVKVPLKLEGGKFEFRPGTVFHFDSWNPNNTATVCPRYNLPKYETTGFPRKRAQLNFMEIAGGAQVEMMGATLRANCDSIWGGVYVVDGSLKTNMDDNATSEPYPMVIRDAYIAIAFGGSPANGTCGLPQSHGFSIMNTSFINNVNGIWDAGRGDAVSGQSNIEHCHFTSDHFVQNWMVGSGLLKSPNYPQHAPGQTNSNTSLIHFARTGLFFDHHDFLVEPNLDYEEATISNNYLQGFTGHGATGRANNLRLAANTFEDHPKVAISLYSRDEAKVYIVGNTIKVPRAPLPFERSPKGIIAHTNNNIYGNTLTHNFGTMYVFDAATLYGIFTEDNPTDVDITEHPLTNQPGNTFSNLDYGIHAGSSTTAPGIRIENNRFEDVVTGVRYQSTVNNGGANVITSLRCNTFAKVNSPYDLTGVDIAGNLTRIRDRYYTTTDHFGGVGDANRNMFGDGGNIQMNRPIENNGGASIEYYGLGNAVEDLTGLITGSSLGFFYSTSGGLTCGSNGNARVMGTSPAAIQEMMDSVQAHVGTAEDMTYYCEKIAGYHLTDSALVSSLESYTSGLWVHNLNAFNYLSHALMSYHRTSGNEGAAQAVNQGLQLHNPGSTEIQRYTQYFDISGRMGIEGRPGFEPDSLDLVNLELVASAGAGISHIACRLLKYYNPGVYCDEMSVDSSLIRLAGKPAIEKPWLGQSYPNPAQEQATIPYMLPDNIAVADIRLIEPVTGRLLSVKPLEPTPGKGEAVMRLDAIPAGIYIYTLTVDGHPLATKKMVLIK